MFVFTFVSAFVSANRIQPFLHFFFFICTLC